MARAGLLQVAVTMGMSHRKRIQLGQSGSRPAAQWATVALTFIWAAVPHAPHVWGHHEWARQHHQWACCFLF